MLSSSSSNKPSEKSALNLAKYAGLGTQILVGLIIALYIGKKADAYFNWHQRLTWIAPSLFILYTLFKVVKETQRNK